MGVEREVGGRGPRVAMVCERVIWPRVWREQRAPSAFPLARKVHALRTPCRH